MSLTLADGTDLRAVLERVTALNAWRERAGVRGEARARAALRKVRISVGNTDRSRGAATTGWGGSYAHVHVKQNESGAKAALLVMHEVAHLVDGGHGAEFHMLLLAAAKEYWPSLAAREADVLRTYEKSGGAGGEYAMDAAISHYIRGER